jgi:hypothetical protein
MEYKKEFVIIGNKNAIAYKEVFPLIKNNKVWLGYNSPCNFIYAGQPTKRVNGLTRWFTNLSTTRRNEKIETGKKYHGYEHMYPKYDNYDAINVDKTSDIPMDYDGIMGVPITYLDKYNPQQFEIIGMGTGDTAKELGITKNYRGRTDLSITVNGVSSCPYNRLLIRKKKGN